MYKLIMEVCSSCVPALASGDVFFLLCAVALMFGWFVTMFLVGDETWNAKTAVKKQERK